MIKAQIIAKIARKTGISRADVRIVIETLLQNIQGAVAKGEEVHFRGFGNFSVRKRARKIGRNISQNTAIVIEEHYIPKFKPSKAFSAKVRTSFRDITSVPEK